MEWNDIILIGISFIVFNPITKSMKVLLENDMKLLRRMNLTRDEDALRNKALRTVNLLFVLYLLLGILMIMLK